MVKGFKDFAASAKFFESPYHKNTMLQLITAIGFAEDNGMPDLPLISQLLEALEIPLGSQDAEDCYNGNVY